MGLVKLRRGFHEARWEEPIIFELSNEGERGILVPLDERLEREVGDGLSVIPEHMRRKELPRLPEVAQMRVLRHFLRLSQETLGADLNIDIGQGTCTMKYSPKVNEAFVSSPKVAELHPYQDEETVQGALEIIYKLDLFLREISGLDRFVFQPGGGSQAILAIASIIRAYFRKKGEDRDEIITTIFSHPSDAAAPAVKGFKVITIYPDPETGVPDVEALKTAVSRRTAGMIVANPEDTGIFNPKVREFCDIVHEAGGLCGYDQANANGIIGIVRAKECGFDMGFFNLHKTFSSPHGCGGPAVGALGVRKELESFLPVPVVDYDSGSRRYYLNYDLPDTIGKVREFYGVFPVLVRAYAWIMTLGEEGLKEVARVAVLNNNYVMHKILREVRGADISYPANKHRIEQVRYTWKKLKEETGVGTEDVIRRIADFGFHLWTSHHPWIVPEPFTIEPTESYSKEELDEYIEALKEVSREAYEDPEVVRNAPHRSVIHKIEDNSWFEDPSKWSITWRLFLKKRGGKF
ncbi:MAG: aminomethyl-transferring glycine dehydrogenase subunit GcvPB [Candidatus Korarchaeum sp.]|nr:aminomethyl-transferring glycine dehydrogenase subunit GcvPB [Candidatus Korarchaeum sp.]MDW8036296.1 aminomethyl-transferring glycine dehydrogenase subunit GcvPB [Candidatus Korarchaeum sp.]